MKRKTKKEILNIIGTLMEAQRQATAMLQEKENLIGVKNLLEQCQECAIQIGEAIEKSEGMGTKAVSYLEAYCENLYHMSMGDGMEKGSLAGLDRQVADVLEQVKHEVEEELPTDLLKVVFMPYKASMWDCMESVWEAAVADKECVAYVVPIPFFERNQQGEINRECYEGELFPVHVPVIPYGEFHLEEEQPDIIYIHNPYDNMNIVTSVHPDYYSFNLKKHTDMLVYIPYYISMCLPKTHSYLSAYMFADKIILSSKNMLKEISQDVPKEKLAVMGTPKAERLLRFQGQREELICNKILPEWRKKIKDKKVILFNVSISGILENSKCAMKKIRYVLSKFENQEDIVLLWRPHPLIDSTLKAMRPELWEEYNQIKEDYIKNDKGIFDETEDAAISAVIADAYIGEATSSIMYYFGILGKPLCFMDWEQTEEWREEERASLFFTDCYFEDNCAWFVPRSELAYDYLCKMDLCSGEVSLVNKLQGKKEKGYYGIAKVGESIVLTPTWCNEIYIYRLNMEQGIKIPLKRMDINGNFGKIFAYQDKVFLTPVNYPAILELDVVTLSLVYYDILVSRETVKDAELLYGNAAMYGDNIYLPYREINVILIFNMRTRAFSEKKINESKSGFSALACNGKEVWAVNEKLPQVMCWNIKTDEVEVWEDFPENFEGEIRSFGEILEMENEMIVLPQNANMALKIDKKLRKADEYRMHSFFKEGERKSSFYYSGNPNYWMAKRYGEKIIALTSYNNGWIQYDDVSDNCVLKPCRLRKADRRKLENQEMDCMLASKTGLNHYVENKSWSISVFINYIADDVYQRYEETRKYYQDKLENFNGNCGKIIHEYIKNEL